jgi:hypothetical protein
LHDPPGDGSYSFIEESSSLRNYASVSFQQSGGASGWLRAQLGLSLSFEAGLGVGISMDAEIINNTTVSFGGGVNYLTNDAVEFTSTVTEKFQTSDNDLITGKDADVYVGGALNMVYAVSDVIDYNFDSCKVVEGKTLAMQPVGFKTTFMYTRYHIQNVLLKELKGIVQIYEEKGSDSAKIYQNQIDVWEQILESDDENVAAMGLIENKSISGEVTYERTVETSQTTTRTVDFSWYLDYGVAQELGLTLAGAGVVMGAEVQGRSEWGNVDENSTTNTQSVGYVLKDDDPDDYFSIDVLTDSINGVPAFNIVAGRSSCPWEEGTQTRFLPYVHIDEQEKEVEQSESAYFKLLLSNLSESEEELDYWLSFDNTFNQNGAEVYIGGAVVSDDGLKYTIPYKDTVPVIIKVNKGPLDYNLDKLKFSLKNECGDKCEDFFLSVNYFKTYNLNLEVSKGGYLNKSFVDTVVREGSQVNLYPTPDKNYEFEKWVVNGSDYSEKLLPLIVNKDFDIEAKFRHVKHQVNISKSGTGVVVPFENGAFNQGDTLVYTATEDSLSIFDKWMVNEQSFVGNLLSIVVDTVMNIEARFVSANYVNVEVEGEGTTSIGKGKLKFRTNDTINIEALPEQDYEFGKWVVEGVDFNKQQLKLVVDEDKQVDLVLNSIIPKYTVEINDGGFPVTPATGVYTYNQNDTLRLSAEVAFGKLNFTHWNINGDTITANPYEMLVTNNLVVEPLYHLTITSVAEMENSFKLKLYPNPIVESAVIKSEKMIKVIELIDLSGRKLAKFDEVNANSFDLNVSNLNSGRYFVKVITKDAIKLISIIVAK